MCRLLGVVSSETTDFGFSLYEAPRCLSVLSNAHPDGWGLAVFGAAGWTLEKQANAAHRDERFLQLAAGGSAGARTRGELLVAHIRKRTVGPIGLQNTHPFRRGDWIFAHNGTIDDVAFLVEHTTERRTAEVEGDTDSERYFAFLLSHVDRGLDADVALLAAIEPLVRRAKLGAANFLLSNGKVLYAFRFGRTLHLLHRQRGDEVRERRSSPNTHAQLETPWSVRRRAYIVASEQMTDEPFREVEEGTLLRIDAGAEPRLTVLRGAMAE